MFLCVQGCACIVWLFSEECAKLLCAGTEPAERRWEHLLLEGAELLVLDQPLLDGALGLAVPRKVAEHATRLVADRRVALVLVQVCIHQLGTPVDRTHLLFPLCRV